MPANPSAISSHERSARWPFAVLAAVGWFALVTQFVMTLLGMGLTPIGFLRTVVVLLTFFTIVTNLAIAVAATWIAWRFNSPCAHPRVATALAVYVTVVFAIYELFLRYLFHPAGLVLVVDTIFHDIVPIAFVAMWWLFIAKGTLRWRDAAPWLIAPAIYAIWIGLLGLVIGGSPYPFLDVNSLGGVRVAINVAGMIGVFWIVGLAFIAIDRRRGSQKAAIAGD